MRSYIKELKPTCIEDMTAMVALYRPGPMDSIPTFIKAKHGEIEIKYLHPDAGAAAARIVRRHRLSGPGAA